MQETAIYKLPVKILTSAFDCLCPISLRLWCWCIVAKQLNGSRWNVVCGRPRPKQHCVRWGPSSPSPKRGQSIQFLAHVYCGQMPAWIKMWLGMEVGVGPGHIVLDWDPAPYPKTAILWPNGWMHEDATWYKGRPRPKPHCVTWNPQSGTAPHFRPISIVAKQTVTHLCYCRALVASDMLNVYYISISSLLDLLTYKGWHTFCPSRWKLSPSSKLIRPSVAELQHCCCWYVTWPCDLSTIWPWSLAIHGRSHVNPCTKFEDPTAICSWVMSSDTSTLSMTLTM